MAFKAAGIIPARWGSTRFPGKALHPIAGKALLQRVWERCVRAKSLASVIIATDDMRIAEAAFDWGADVAMTSPKHHSGTDRIAEVAAKAREFSHIINIQGDEPLIDPKLIDRLTRELQRDRKLEMITAAHPFETPADAESPHQVKVVLDRNENALYFSRSMIPFVREALETARPWAGGSSPPPVDAAARGRTASTVPGGRTSAPFFRHQGIYGYTRDLLLRFVRWKPSPLERAESLEQLRALENGVRIHVLLTKTGSPGIDTPEDAVALERILARPARREHRS
jgi:3-deoxy-manno-octulosonate cytidylyltransferase (CMP-KDO synthetase)